MPSSIDKAVQELAKEFGIAAPFSEGGTVNTLCPSCQTAFKISAQDVGRQFSCFKCNANLVVDASGIQLADGQARAPVAEVSQEPPPASAARTVSPFGSALLQALRQIDIPTWLFGVGSFCIIVFLFFPHIDQAKVARAQAAVETGQLREDRLDKDLKEKKDVNAADEELRKKGRDSWAKEKDRLEGEVLERQAATKKNDYWYTWGMMLGFLFLAAAALGYLNPGQPLIRRIVGSIVIVAEIILIFAKYVSGGGLLHAILG